MLYSKKISSGPTTKDIDGQLTNGYFLSIYEEWEDEFVDDETGEVFYRKQSDAEGWDIFPNGKFIYGTCCDTTRWCGEEEGTFDSLQYEEFVNQMKELKTDWIKELSYDEDTATFTWG